MTKTKCLICRWLTEETLAEEREAEREETRLRLEVSFAKCLTDLLVISVCKKVAKARH